MQGHSLFLPPQTRFEFGAEGRFFLLYRFSGPSGRHGARREITATANRHQTTGRTAPEAGFFGNGRIVERSGTRRLKSSTPTTSPSGGFAPLKERL